MQGDKGQLRVALECHTCFDWLMPVMDEFRQRWPEVEIDLVSGFHSEPADLLRSGEADLVIGSPYGPDFTVFPLFRFEILVVMAQKHRLAGAAAAGGGRFHGRNPDHLSRAGRAHRPDPRSAAPRRHRIRAPHGGTDGGRAAAGGQPARHRRLAELGIKNYVDYDYVMARPVGEHGLWSDLFVSVPDHLQDKAYVRDFVSVIREQCAATLDGIKLLS
jgi:LysR family transcriptional regulator for metE and metH